MKTVQCNCKSGCQTKRCVCFKNNEPCDDNCGCIECQNPLNDIETNKLTRKDDVNNHSKTNKKKKKRKNIFDIISKEDAFDVLKILYDRDKIIAKQIEAIVDDLLRQIDIDNVSEEVYFDLDSLDVEELWQRSGSTRDGYIEPHEMSWEMIEDALEPFLNELKKYQELSLFNEAKQYIMGILKGIYLYEKKSNSEFKDWAVDAPGEFFESIFDDWKKSCKIDKDIDEVSCFVEENCNAW